MAKTLLNGVNEVLKKMNLIQGDSGALTTLSDSGRQTFIDKTVQAWNEVMEELYDATDTPTPSQQAESTITLVTGTRSYSLASDLVELRFPFIDKTNNQYIWEYDYNALLLLDPEQDDTGLPHWGAISPVDGNIHLDRAPTSTENGRVYTYQYDKDLSVSAAADTFPFTDAVFRAMVPAVAEYVRRLEEGDFDAAIYKANLGRAARFLNRKQERSSWLRRI